MGAGNEVDIRVRVRDETAPGFAAARSNSRTTRSQLANDGAAAGNALRLAGSGADSFSLSLRGIAMAGAPGQISGIVAAAQQLIGAFLIAPGVIAATGAILGTLGLGLSGVSDAMTATSSGAGKTGSSVAAMARQIRDANRAIEDAERGVLDATERVADAQRGVDAAYRRVADAARQVTAAEKAVAAAERDAADAARAYEKALASEQRAQKGIDTARKDALRTLEDLTEAQDDSARSVEGAQLRLKRAQIDLVKTNNDVTATSLDKAEAAYAVKQAADALSDAQRDQTDTTAKLTDAQQKGIDGSDQVVAAEQAAADAHDQTVAAAQRVADANDRIVEAQQGVIDAQQGVADANDGVAEANRGLATAQQGVLDANRDVADAMQNLQDIYAQQAEAAARAAGGVDAYQKALAKLSPEARDFVLTLKALAPEWERMQNSVQDDLFAGLSGDVRDLAGTYIPLLQTGLGGIATAINGMIGYSIESLLDPGAISDINTILANTSLFLGNAGTALGDFLTGFLNLAEVGSGFLPGFGQWISDIAAAFLAWTENGSGAGGTIETLISDGLTGFGQLWDILTNVGDIISSVTTGLGGGEDGGGFLSGIVDLTAAIADFANDPGVQWTLMFIGEFSRMLIDTIPIWGPVAAGFGIVAAATWLWNAALAANPISLIIISITLLVAAFVYLWNNSEDFRNFWIGIWENIKTAVSTAVDWVTGLWNGLWATIQSVADWIGQKLGSMWDGLTGGLKNAVNGALSLLNGLISGVNRVISGLNTVSPVSIPFIPYIPYLAHGGIAGGMAMVGEQGPELVKLPQGSTVYPTGQSKRMLGDAAQGGSQGSGGGMTVEFGGNVDGAFASAFMMLVRTGQIQIKATG